MGKDCGRGNERVDAKALAVYHVAEGDGDGSKIPPNLPAFELSKLHVVIHHFITRAFQRKRPS